MMNRKGISELVTTVLMVLLVLAAILIVWQVTKGILTKSAESVEKQSECIGLELNIVSVTNDASNIYTQVSRGGDNIAGNALNVIATCKDGNSKSATDAIDALGIKKVTIACGAGNVGQNSLIKLALKTDKGATCLGEQKTADLV